jgi:hypothetical protein
MPAIDALLLNHPMTILERVKRDGKFEAEARTKRREK